jgi:phosphate:Na+ symporter
MQTKLLLEMGFAVIGGLAIFLLGMKHMSEGLQTIAGNRLRHLISAVTNNRIMATGIGTLTTCIIQSSSVTTVMVVGLVNSGFMTLAQGIGVIMGANIGTTITGWILVLKIGKYGLPLLAIAAFFYLFSKKERIKFWGMALMGIGMIFFGLELMKNGFKPIRSMPEFSAWFSAFNAVSYFGVIKCVLAGAILTLIVQSSSATLGITMGLAATGVIPFETAAALVLGENIGTTITAFLSSLGTTTNAKRAAYAHIMFNVIGVIWITSIFPLYIFLIKSFLGIDPNQVVLSEGVKTYPYIIAGIAAVHTGFNVANTAIFLPFTQLLAGLLNKIIPDSRKKEAPHLTRLDFRILETPITGIEQSRVEILRMADHTTKMMDYLNTINDQPEADDDLVKKIFHREEVMDIMQKEIVTFLADLFTANLPVSIINEGRLQMRIADEYESVSDYIVNVLKLNLRLKHASQKFDDQEKSDISSLHKAVSSYLNLVNTGFQERNPDIITKAKSQSDAITHQFREMRNRHLSFLAKTPKDPLVGMIYMDTLNAYRRIKDHILNVAEALAGEK